MASDVESCRLFVRLLLYVLSSDPEIEVDSSYSLPLFNIKGKIIDRKPVHCWSCGSMCLMKLLAKPGKFPIVVPFKGTDEEEFMTLGHHVPAAVFRILKRKSQGYLPSNIAWQCKTCNVTQSTMNNDQFRDFLTAAKKVTECKAIQYCSTLPEKKKYLNNIQQLIHYIHQKKITGDNFHSQMTDFMKANHFPSPPEGNDIGWWHLAIQEIITAMYFDLSNPLPKMETLPWNFQVLRYSIARCINSTSPICEMDVPDLPDHLPDRFFIKIAGKKHPFSCATFEEMAEHAPALYHIVLQGVKLPSSLIVPSPEELAAQLVPSEPPILGAGAYAGS